MILPLEEMPQTPSDLHSSKEMHGTLYDHRLFQLEETHGILCDYDLTFHPEKMLGIL